MPASKQSIEPAFRLADRLAAARRGRFVGREAELELFRSALLAEQPPFAVLYLYGPGGIGKTTLLREYARMAEQQGVPALLLDGRGLDPSPQAFSSALRRALGLDEAGSPLEALAQAPRSVLLIDTYETLAPLDAWLREDFFPQLPGQSLVVMAGRTPPAAPWRSDLDWAALTRIVSLRNLRPEESRVYLAARGVAEGRHPEVLAFTHGHPLALSLVADVLNQRDAQIAFGPQANPDVVQLLLERFLRQAPSLAHREALEICAHVWITTEALLADVLGEEEAPALFAWLRGLSFIEQGPLGLFPHDLAREVLDADLRWRNPQAYQALHHQVRKHFDKIMRAARGHAKQLVMRDITYLYRHNPVTSSYYDWDVLGKAYTEPATPEDEPAILEMVQRHEGDASAEIARYWLQRQPGAFTIFRSKEDRSLGFMAMLTLSAVTPTEAEADPAMAAAQRFLQRYGPLRKHEELDCVRFWMGREDYQAADIHNLVTMVAGTAFREGNPHRAWSLATVADADHWQPFFASLNFDYTREADFTVGGRSYGVFTHDWRVEPVSAWAKRVGDRQLEAELQTRRASPTPSEQLVVLSEPEFTKAVRQALRDYTRPAALVTNPLLRSRLLTREAGGEPTPAALQGLLRDAAATLQGNPRDEKLYRAIRRTYLEPAPSQEQAAERLGLPFSTYRYHLTNGIKRITAWMWQRELYSVEG